MEFHTDPVAPFLKWAGGKRWLAPAVAELFSGCDGRYVEPFIGSGACYFALSARDALLADLNAELVNCFSVVRDSPDELICRLNQLSLDHDTFDRQRGARMRSAVGRAARFIYLNRAAFNGLYRVNRNGQFNVPFGCKPGTVICDRNSILACSLRLQGAQLMASDFADTMKLATPSDRICIDPPYTVKHNTNAFRRYNERLFSWADQARLATCVAGMAQRGARIVLTNANHCDIRRLYSAKEFLAFGLDRPTNMAARAEKRGRSEELLLLSRGLDLGHQKARAILNSHFPSRVRTARLLGD